MEKTKIRVAIAGYGNLGKSVESGIAKNKDMQLVCIFTRRETNVIKTKCNIPVVNEKDIELWKDKIDIAFLCGGSAKDLPIQGPKYAKLFNTIDAFDTHDKALEYINSMDKISKISNKIAMTCIGWDPGLFSNMRLLIKSILPYSKTYTFWGNGISQGHSDAIRRINGVKDARQYTVPIEYSLQKIREGKVQDFTKREMHRRVCYVVAYDWADKQEIQRQIKNMPYYFSEYNTEVNFVSYEELINTHSKMYHGGTVIGVGSTPDNTRQNIEFKLKLNSNPEFTAAVLIAYARATYKMWQEGMRGAKSFADVAPKYLIDMSYEEIIENFV